MCLTRDIGRGLKSFGKILLGVAKQSAKGAVDYTFRNTGGSLNSIVAGGRTQKIVGIIDSTSMIVLGRQILKYFGSGLRGNLAAFAGGVTANALKGVCMSVKRLLKQEKVPERIKLDTEVYKTLTQEEAEKEQKELMFEFRKKEKQRQRYGVVDVAGSIYVRIKPWGKIIGSFRSGEKVKIRGTYMNWYIIEYYGNEAYVLKSFIKEKKPKLNDKIKIY